MNMANMYILGDIISVINGSRKLRCDIESRLNKLPRLAAGFSSIARNSVFQGYIAERPKAFFGTNSASLFLMLASSMSIETNGSSCPNHPEVKLNSDVTKARDAIIVQSHETKMICNLSLTAQPHTDCVHCRILKMVVNEALVIHRTYPTLHTQHLYRSVFYVCWQTLDM